MGSTSGKYPFTFLTVYFSDKKRGLLCFTTFTPPENEFGNQLYSRFLIDFSTFSLVQARTGSYESKNVSGRFPDVIPNLLHLSIVVYNKNIIGKKNDENLQHLKHRQ